MGWGWGEAGVWGWGEGWAGWAGWVDGWWMAASKTPHPTPPPNYNINEATNSPRLTGRCCQPRSPPPARSCAAAPNGRRARAPAADRAGYIYWRQRRRRRLEAGAANRSARAGASAQAAAGTAHQGLQELVDLVGGRGFQGEA